MHNNSFQDIIEGNRLYSSEELPDSLLDIAGVTIMYINKK